MGHINLKRKKKVSLKKFETFTFHLKFKVKHECVIVIKHFKMIKMYFRKSSLLKENVQGLLHLEIRPLKLLKPFAYTSTEHNV